jgi:uncharacterized protein YbaP (TraB family)
VLLGTVHAGLQRFYPLPGSIEHAFADARRLLVELDPQARREAIRSAAQGYALLPDGMELAGVLQPATLRALRRAFHGRPWALDEVQRLQPWALAMLLPNADDARLDVDPLEGVDLHLIRRARARGLPVIELEAADAQVRAFAGGPLVEQEAALALRLAQREAWDRSFVEIVDAWRRGDLAALARLKDRAYPAQGVLADLRRRLFTERDATIAARLADALEEPAAGFATVGVFHLAGPDALQVELARLGVRTPSLADPA